MKHEIRIKKEQTGSSSHYNIPFYTSSFICSCGWKHAIPDYPHNSHPLLDHKVEVLLKEAGITFKVEDD